MQENNSKVLDHSVIDGLKYFLVANIIQVKLLRSGQSVLDNL